MIVEFSQYATAGMIGTVAAIIAAVLIFVPLLLALFLQPKDNSKLDNILMYTCLSGAFLLGACILYGLVYAVVAHDAREDFEKRLMLKEDVLVIEYLEDDYFTAYVDGDMEICFYESGKGNYVKVTCGE